MDADEKPRFGGGCLLGQDKHSSEGFLAWGKGVSQSPKSLKKYV